MKPPLQAIQPGAEGQIIGQLFIVQSTLDVLPTPQHLLVFLTRAVERLPCVAAVRSKLTDSPERAGGLAVSEAESGWIRLPIETFTYLFGYIDVKVSNAEEFDRYHPYLVNIVNTAGIILENRRVSSEIREANAALLRAQETLEERVRERTAQLRDANTRLKKEIAERERTEERLAQLARYDTLTGLPNRNNFQEYLQQSMAEYRASGQGLALMFIDLDHFKHINDCFGHDAGDELLRQVAQRISGVLTPGQQIFRLGGDEFTVVLRGCNDGMQEAAVAQSILGLFESAFTVSGNTLHVGASIGIAHMTAGDTLETLIKKSDLAMYRSKELGRNQFQFYSEYMRRRTNKRMAMELRLRHAIDRGELELAYQPQVDLSTGKIAGMEALMRWHNRDLGIVSPEQFIPLAEELGIIHRIEEWLLYEACRQARAWETHYGAKLRIAVNISSANLQRKDVTGIVRNALDATGLAPDLLDLELTETALLGDSAGVTRQLTLLRDWGIEISLDDFGTGYSSLSYLSRFPVTRLKIDRSFIGKIASGAQESAIVEAILKLGQTLGLRTLAEGVETADQLSFVVERGGDECQGNFFSEALNASDTIRLIQSTDISLPPISATGPRLVVNEETLSLASRLAT